MEKVPLELGEPPYKVVEVGSGEPEEVLQKACINTQIKKKDDGSSFSYDDDIKLVGEDGVQYSIKEMMEMNEVSFDQHLASIHHGIGKMIALVSENSSLGASFMPSINMTMFIIEIVSLRRKIAKLEERACDTYCKD